MTPETARDLMRQYGEVAKRSVGATAHAVHRRVALGNAEDLAGLAADIPEADLYRCLGIVQGLMVSAGTFSMADLKRHAADGAIPPQCPLCLGHHGDEVMHARA